MRILSTAMLVLLLSLTLISCGENNIPESNESSQADSKLEMAEEVLPDTSEKADVQEETVASEPYNSDTESAENDLSEIFREISSQDFYNDSVIHMEIIGDKINAAEEYLNNVNPALGKIDIEFVKCDYSISDLEEILSEIKSQGFYDKSSFEDAISGGTLVITVDDEKDLKDFVSQKPYKDAVVIRSRLAYTNPIC